MASWTSTYKDAPTDGSSPSLADDQIRALKANIEDRIKNEHLYYGDSTSGLPAADWVHREGSAVAYYESAAPTNRPNGTTALSSADAGRLWIDSDNEILKYWDGDSWEPPNFGTTTIDGRLYITPTADSTASIYLQTDANNESAMVRFNNGESSRWIVGKDSGSVTPDSNKEENYITAAYDDNGSFLRIQMMQERSTGLTYFEGALFINDSGLEASGFEPPSEDLTSADILRVTLPDDTADSGVNIFNSDGSIMMYNGVATANQFSPTFVATSKDAGNGLLIEGKSSAGEDSGAVALVRLRGDIDGAAASTRPVLEVQNYTTSIFQIDSSGNIDISGSTNGDRKIDFASDASILWDESADEFVLNKTLNFIGHRAPAGTIHAQTDANTIFDAIAPFIPNINDTVIMTGSIEDIRSVSYAERTGSSEITFYGVDVEGNPVPGTLVVIDGGGGGLAAALAW